MNKRKNVCIFHAKKGQHELCLNGPKHNAKMLMGQDTIFGMLYEEANKEYQRRKALKHPYLAPEQLPSIKSDQVMAVLHVISDKLIYLRELQIKDLNEYKKSVKKKEKKI